MDIKTVFVRTSKGEDEVHSRTMHLPGDIKRALMMVDGAATFAEISKRAAPSLRVGLEAMLQELEKDGFIADKAKAGNLPKMSVPPKISVPPRMSVPTKMATPHKPQPVNEGAGDLDFMSGFSASTPKATGAGTDKASAVSEKLKEEAEEKARQEIEIEAAKFQAQQEAEVLLHKAEQEAARIREEAEREKQRAAAEIHAHEEAARRAKEEAEAVRLRAEQEAKERREAEAKALQQAEAARKIAEQEAVKAREAAERLARQEREAAKAREEAEKRAIQAAEAKAAAETPPAAKPDTFAFGAFQVDELQHPAKPQKIDQPAQTPGQTGPASSVKPDTFAFDTFHLDGSQPPAKQHEVDQPAQTSRPAGTASSAKTDTFSFDSFKVDIPPVEPPKKEPAGPAQQTGKAERIAQHAESGQPVKHEAPPFAASKPVGGTPSQEEIQRATQERIATEKRMEEEALAAKKHAEDQAKAHAEAEKRLAEAAKTEIEHAAKQTKYAVDVPSSTPAAKHAQVERVRRKPFSWGKLVGFFFKLGVLLLALLVGALFAAPYVLPTRDYMPKVEKFVSAKLHQPTHIGYLSVRFLPTPRLELGEIYIGEVKQFQAEQAIINFAVNGLFIDAKPIDSIELQGVKVSGAGLQSVSAWLQQLAADNQYPVARMMIGQGTLDTDAVKLTGVAGTLDFNKNGEFAKANLRSNEGKYSLDMSTALGSKLKVVITVRDNALPMLPNWTFDELTAKGELSNNDLSISEFEGRIYGGTLQGNATINWRSGWRAQGTMVAKTITMQRLNNLLEGNVEGTARFKMTAVDLAGLAGTAVLDGSFMAKDGMISGMDIVETARTRSREHLPGGRTHFDELSGTVAYANNILRFKQIKVTTNVLNATAVLDVDKQQISGNLVARLMLQDVTKPVDLHIGGVTNSPTLHFAPK